MSIEIPLKLKYRSPKPKGTNRANYSGNSGKRIHGTVPLGMRKQLKGKTRFGGFGHV
jgi:hypothetical protein